MNVMSVYYSYRNPTENFLKFSPYFMYLRHSQITKMHAKAILFIEFPDLQLHHDPMFDSLYITGTCHFRLYFFARRKLWCPSFSPTIWPDCTLYSHSPSHGPSRTPNHTTTSTCLSTPGCSLPILWEWPLGGCLHLLLLLYSQRWLRSG